MQLTRKFLAAIIRSIRAVLFDLVSLYKTLRVYVIEIHAWRIYKRTTCTYVYCVR